jgi:hypothetical protein
VSALADTLEALEIAQVINGRQTESSVDEGLCQQLMTPRKHLQSFMSAADDSRLPPR